MFGLGVVKGLGITLKHFINTFKDDLQYFPKSMMSEEAFAKRQSPEGAGLFTVEYPEMKLKTPENFRFLPFLLTDYEVPKTSPNFDKDEWYEQNRCTSCGICAKVCPPQCIWIVRTDDPETGKPIPQPAEFYIDTDICMNCGYCAEYCPFDAIKMDHDFELSDYEREVGHIHDLDRLLKPTSYYASIRPTWNAKEEEARRLAEEEKQRKEEEKRRKAEEKAAAAKAKAEAEAQAKAAAEAEAEAKAAEATPAPAATREAAPVAEVQAADTLTKIEGIGPKISDLLNEAGITTFAQLADTPVDKLQGILDAAGPNFKLADPTSWPEQAKLAATGKWDELQELQNSLVGGRAGAAPIVPDELSKIEGIGPKISGLLNEAEIMTYAQLADSPVSVLQEILEKAGPRFKLADPTTWPEQAKLAAEGKWDELKALQDNLKGGRQSQTGPF